MREAQSSAMRLLNAYGIPADIVEEYDCIPVRVRQVGESIKLQTMFGARALKVVTGNLEQVRRAFQVTEFLAQKGYYRVPRFIRNRYGDAFIRDGDRLYFMTDWLGGRNLDVYRSDEVLGAVEALARWHVATKGALAGESLTSGTPTSDEWTRLKTMVTNFRKKVEKSPERTEFEKLFLDFAGELTRDFEEAVEELTTLSWNEFEEELIADGWLCNGNFQADPVRYDGEHFTISEYQYVYSGSPLTDLTDFLDACLPASNWDERTVSKIVEIYLSAVNQPTWEPYVRSLLKVPLTAFRLAEQYQNEEHPDEGLFVDLLEDALQRGVAKRQVLNRWDEELEKAKEPPEQTDTEMKDVVHADLKTEEIGNPSNRRLRIKPYQPVSHKSNQQRQSFSPKDQIKLWGEARDITD